jgi:hypothetical protein
LDSFVQLPPENCKLKRTASRKSAKVLQLTPPVFLSSTFAWSCFAELKGMSHEILILKIQKISWRLLNFLVKSGNYFNLLCVLAPVVQIFSEKL